jgi:hypothetical protein
MNNNEEDYIDDAFDEDNYSEEDSNKVVKGKAANVGNGRMQNDLVDKEVEQVIMKSASNVPKEKKPAAGGYAIPDSDEDVDQDQEEMGDEEEDDEEVQDDPDGEEDEEDIDQQIVNITSKN